MIHIDKTWKPKACRSGGSYEVMYVNRFDFADMARGGQYVLRCSSTKRCGYGIFESTTQHFTEGAALRFKCFNSIDIHTLDFNGKRVYIGHTFEPNTAEDRYFFFFFAKNKVFIVEEGYHTMERFQHLKDYDVLWVAPDHICVRIDGRIHIATNYKDSFCGYSLLDVTNSTTKTIGNYLD